MTAGAWVRVGAEFGSSATPVQRYGRTTGLTRGAVVAVELAIIVLILGGVLLSGLGGRKLETDPGEGREVTGIGAVHAVQPGGGVFQCDSDDRLGTHADPMRAIGRSPRL